NFLTRAAPRSIGSGSRAGRPAYPWRMNNMFDAGWRALAYCLHPRVIVLTLLPVLVAASIAVILGHFYWDSLLQSVDNYFAGWDFINAMFAWLAPLGIGDLRRLIVPVVV